MSFSRMIASFGRQIRARSVMSLSAAPGLGASEVLKPGATEVLKLSRRTICTRSVMSLSATPGLGSVHEASSTEVLKPLSTKVLKPYGTSFTLKPILERLIMPYKPTQDLLETPPEGLIQEVRLSTFKEPNLLIGKGVWASYEINDYVYNIKRGYLKKGNRKEKWVKAKADAQQEIDSLSSEEVSKFSAVWIDRAGHSKTHWSYQAVQHGYFSTEVRMENYVQMTGQMMDRFLGQGSSENLKDILLELGYVPGYYYDAKEMVDRVSEKLGVAVYPVFKIEEDDHIPMLDYLCLATTLACALIHHPTAHLITTGMFLFPRH